MSSAHDEPPREDDYRPDNYEARRRRRAARVKSPPLSLDHLPPEIRAAQEARESFRFNSNHIRALIHELQNEKAWRFLDDPDFAVLSGILPENVTIATKRRIESFFQLCLDNKELRDHLPTVTWAEVTIPDEKWLPDLDAKLNQDVKQIGLCGLDWLILHTMLRLAIFAFSQAEDIIDQVTDSGEGDV